MGCRPSHGLQRFGGWPEVVTLTAGVATRWRTSQAGRLEQDGMANPVLACQGSGRAAALGTVHRTQGLGRARLIMSPLPAS